MNFYSLVISPCSAIFALIWCIIFRPIIEDITENGRQRVWTRTKSSMKDAAGLSVANNSLSVSFTSSNYNVPSPWISHKHIRPRIKTSKPASGKHPANKTICPITKSKPTNQLAEAVRPWPACDSGLRKKLYLDFFRPVLFLLYVSQYLLRQRCRPHSVLLNLETWGSSRVLVCSFRAAEITQSKHSEIFNTRHHKVYGWRASSITVCVWLLSIFLANAKLPLIYPAQNRRPIYLCHALRLEFSLEEEKGIYAREYIGVVTSVLSGVCFNVSR